MEGCLYRGYTAHLNTRAVLDAAQQCQCPLVLSSVAGCVRRGTAAAATGATVDSAGASALKESTFSLTADLGRSYKESGAETSMKRSSAERDAFGSRVHGRQPPSVVDVKGSVGRTNVELEGDDAQRLTALRSLRRKHNKPEDWMTGTFHQYDISDVVGAGTFGQVSRDSLRCAFFSCFVPSCSSNQKDSMLSRGGTAAVRRVYRLQPSVFDATRSLVNYCYFGVFH